MVHITRQSKEYERTKKLRDNTAHGTVGVSCYTQFTPVLKRNKHWSKAPTDSI